MPALCICYHCVAYCACDCNWGRWHRPFIYGGSFHLSRSQRCWCVPSISFSNCGPFDNFFSLVAFVIVVAATSTRKSFVRLQLDDIVKLKRDYNFEQVSETIKGPSNCRNSRMQGRRGWWKYNSEGRIYEVNLGNRGKVSEQQYFNHHSKVCNPTLSSNQTSNQNQIASWDVCALLSIRVLMNADQASTRGQNKPRANKLCNS